MGKGSELDRKPARTRWVWASLCGAGICAAIILVCGAGTSAAQSTAIQGSDGSRAPAAHLIPLMAEPLPGKTEGQAIRPGDSPVLPFSTRMTCSECHISRHDYPTIATGWHFNAVDPNVPAGRPGEPWILVDSFLGVQIPLSYRGWAGTHKPDALKISPLQFTYLFGRQMPGGGPGEIEIQNQDEIARQIVSGEPEINCLACHDHDPAQDQAEYATQIAKQNLRWAATASAGFAAVSGSAKEMPDTYDYTMPDTVEDPKKMVLRPTVTYRQGAFDEKSQVFFDVSGKASAQRCYFCHSTLRIDNGGEKWQQDEDVHLTAGLSCADCHREGLDHDTIRGYEGEVSKNALAAETSCKSCHLGDGSPPQAGRLGAPRPKHAGIPPVHFDKLSCTACHSGPWPQDKTTRCKTSMAHALGTHNVNKSLDALPHIVYPVYAPGQDGKIAPHKMIWPAFWGTLGKEGAVDPIPLDVVRKAIAKVLSGRSAATPGDWVPLESKDIAAGLSELAKAVEGKPAYVAGGRLYRLDEAGKLAEDAGHAAARPYLWPLAHDVRPASQSLGIGKCKDCHSTDAPFFFGRVATDSPVAGAPQTAGERVGFQKLKPFYVRLFAFTFVFRPWFKIVALGASGLIGVVLLLYGLKALGAVVKVLGEKDAS